MGLELRRVLAVPEAISTLPAILPSPSSRELRLTTVNVETSVAMAMAEEDAAGTAAKGDLKVVCEGVTRNLELRDEGRGQGQRRGSGRVMMLF